MIREEARAKVNLRLRVLGRGEDGYHALETLFARVELADRVELEATDEPGIRLEVEDAIPRPPGKGGDSGDDDGEAQDADAREGGSGPADDGGEPPPGTRPDGDRARVPTGPDNLCWRAARAFHGALGEEPSVEIRLRKRIPAGAGLGGGSADAAAVLRGLNRLHRRDGDAADMAAGEEDAAAAGEEGGAGAADGLHGGPLPARRLFELAAELGADVPFALAGVPMALGWGRGQRLLPLEPPEPRPLLVVVPRVRVATADAYAWLDEAREARGAGDGGAAAPATEPGRGSQPAAGRDDTAPVVPGRLFPPPGELARWDRLAELAHNDFEPPVFARHPELGWWREELAGEGAELALLCGSGSALLGVFESARRRDAAAERFREGGEVAVVETRGPV